MHAPRADRSPLYHRLASTTQTPEHAALQERSGELWGRPPRGSDIPAVKAYRGPLPPGKLGIEFTTEVEPDPWTAAHRVRWTGPRAGVIVDEEFARIRIEVVSNNQR